MRVLSLCSGAGGLELGLERAGMTVVGHCEIDPTARQVLAHHWPDIPCWDDITTMNGHDWNGRTDLVCGGTPCTDLSVAGRREGLGGQHSRIFWDFCRIADKSNARWVLWENVAGALSSNRGGDFAAVLWGLTGHHPGVPENGWKTSGVCVGTERAVVWRLLDARWFGVAQRRRRVFALACPPADIGRAVEILFEPESVSGNPQPVTAQGQDIAGTLGGGSGGRGWAPDTDRMTFIATALHHTQDPITSVEFCHTLSLDGAAVFLSGAPAVRRLTPTECERLMGWPDGWTRYGADNREIADSHRYRLCGNGVVANVTEWIGRRILQQTEDDQ